MHHETWDLVFLKVPAPEFGGVLILYVVTEAVKLNERKHFISFIS